MHRRTMRISIIFGSIAALIQPLHGDRLAQQTAILQPIKLAAMGSLFRTSEPAPLLIGGLPSEETQTETYGIHIPRLLSFLAHGDFSSKVIGLDAAPRENWPPVLPIHIAFQLMVAIGTGLAGVGAFSIYVLKKQPELLVNRLFLKLIILCAPLGFIAIEAGWAVTELGRQPWIIYGIMKTKDAVTPMPGLVYPMLLFTSVYLFLSVIVGILMSRQFSDVD